MKLFSITSKSLLLLVALSPFLLSPSLCVEVENQNDKSVELNEASQREDLQRATNKFFTADYAVMRYDEEYLHVEIYALIDRSLLGTQSVDGGVTANYRITFKFFSEDSLITGDSWSRMDFSATPEERHSGQKIPELVKYRVLPGQYRVDIEVVDEVKKVYQVEGFRLDLEPVNEGEVAVSDIIIASNIQKAPENAGEFDHNGLLVLPNAERMFGTNNPMIYYYMEIYNLTPGLDHNYLVIRQILDENRTPVKTLEDRTRPVPAESCVEIDAFSIATLRTGSYSLMITVTDETSGKKTSAERRFWVYRPGDYNQAVTINNPGFDLASMTDEEVAEELKMVRYIMSSKVQNMVKKLDAEGKRLFLAKFWITNDTDKSTSANEARIEYMRRVDEANIRFKGSFRQKGWQTDRGRVFLMLGEPDNIEDHPFELQERKGYQIWYYDHVEGGVVFVFVDRNGYGDYVQVHSNKVGELSNTQWRSTEKLGNY